MKLRDACTWMWCCRTLNLYLHWVMPSLCPWCGAGFAFPHAPCSVGGALSSHVDCKLCWISQLPEQWLSVVGLVSLQHFYLPLQNLYLLYWRHRGGFVVCNATRTLINTTLIRDKKYFFSSCWSFIYTYFGKVSLQFWLMSPSNPLYILYINSFSPTGTQLFSFVQFGFAGIAIFCLFFLHFQYGNSAFSKCNVADFSSGSNAGYQCVGINYF